MKNAFSIFAAALAVLLASCAQPFDLTGELGGRTLVYESYLTFDLGMGFTYSCKLKQSFDFNDEGDKGRYETSMLAYGYTSRAAADAGLYSGKDWYRIAGERGSFEYDAAGLELSMSTIDVWTLKAGSTDYYASDFSYRPLCAAVDPACTAASRTERATIVFNRDNLRPAYAADGEGWTSTSVASSSSTVSGVMASESTTTTDTWTVAEGSLSRRRIETRTQSSSGSAVTTSKEEHETFEVLHAFLNGGGSGEEAFADIWKAGNDLTFGVVRTRFVETGGVEGQPAAAAPEIGADGTGLTGVRDSGSWQYIDANPGEPFRIGFSRQEGYICESSASASRSIEAYAARRMP